MDKRKRERLEDLVFKKVDRARNLCYDVSRILQDNGKYEEASTFDSVGTLLGKMECVFKFDEKMKKEIKI